MRIIAFTYLFVFMACTAFGQEEWEDTKVKVGIKTGITASTLQGTELQNPSYKFGYVAGAYVKTQTKKHLFVQTEALGNYRGSKFKNDIGEYNKITLFYVDVTLMAGYQFGANKNQAILIGPTISYLGLSSMFIQGQVKSEQNKLALEPWDVSAAVYYQIFNDYIGFQFGVKQGLTNINNGINFVNVKPVTGTGGTIQSLSLEISMLF